MGIQRLHSYAAGHWHAGTGSPALLVSAIDGAPVAEATSGGLDMAAMLRHAHRRGGPALRALTFHERASLLKALAQALTARKEELYALSALTGATRADSWIDIDGGIGTLFVYASKGKRELPNETFLVDGAVEGLSRNGTFLGQHIRVPREGASVQINAFNFPVWGMLEKLAPAILGGMPVIAKPATATAYLAEKAARIIVESGILPEGAFQFVAGSTGDLLDHLTSQDMVGFTGSLATSTRLQANANILKNAVHFTAERDSLNCSILGPDIEPGSPDFDIFIKEVAREMTVKAGQKCTAIRRIILPASRMEAVQAALSKRLAGVAVGDPRLETTRMGPLASLDQRADVRAQIERLRAECDIVWGDPDAASLSGVDAVKGAFVTPMLLAARDAQAAERPHDTEAFGPAATLLAYGDLDNAVALARRGDGSLAGSLVTRDPEIARRVIFGAGAFHGRLLVLNADCAAESTGHGSPMPHLVHGGPGRAGGGEELGGIRAVMHHMQRVALQGSPAMLTALTKSYVKGTPEPVSPAHPFRLAFEDLVPGQSFHSPERVITLADIEHFAHFTGDTFYAHMDEEAVKGHPFFPGRVAHGYLLLSFAAGLFVEPKRGPVLANYGLDNLRFLKPVTPGESIRVRLTVKSKSPRNAAYGEVRWDVEITTGTGETAATYDLLTMNAYAEPAATAAE
ncbi:phenylacetic acid degradation bifunctional protein PaaZ [Rhabdaerophilum sp. SD176]|uniref:phenylacetic acid degradation bifunctional protein PaaZ n=1 Tax=Rhabdaerophilum sp. SD176 TaxID=2983548 RepID=UPI0024DF4C05|nr:phenylacetic acid degradation bifunctional protein PaaZ [Rhabdaerophilum sp. SD176]